MHVWELAKAHWIALQYLREFKRSDVFNLGSDQGYSVREIINICQKVTGKQIAVHETERRVGDPPVLISASKKANEQLNWSPENQSLEAIISSAWKWQQKWYQNSPNTIR